jgi:hypothetical protein
VQVPAHATVVDTKLLVLSTVGVDSAAIWRRSW